MIFRRRNPDDTLTDAQRARMALFSVSGTTDGPTLWTAQRRLEGVRWAVDHGRISEDREARDDR